MKKTSPSRAIDALPNQLVLLACLTFITIAHSEKPNIVFVLNDDVSAIEYDFLTSPGRSTLNGAKTPTLNMMARDGVSFLTGWSMPICGPTRGSLVTGLYGQVTGWRSNTKPPGSLGDRFGTFGQLAQKAGYKVLIAGKWQMVGEPNSYGYDEACLWQADDDPSKPLSFFLDQYKEDGGRITPGTAPQSGQGSRYWNPFIVKNKKLVPSTETDYGPDVIFKCARNFIRRQVAAGNKFFVYIPALLAHATYDPDIPDGGFDNYLPVPKRNAKGKFIRKETGPGSIKRNIEYQDYLMRTLLNAIKSVGQSNNTVTFFVGDNGTLGYGKKKFPSERSTRVPFVVYGPGIVKNRGNSFELVSTNDVYATLKGLMRSKKIMDMARPHSVDFSRFLRGKVGFIKRKWLYALYERSHWLRTKKFIYDGNSDLWKCSNRDERSCKEIKSTDFGDQETRLVRKFEKIICILEKGGTVITSRLSQPQTC